MSYEIKPKGVCQLLEIPKETLRYWRQHIDPQPNRKIFSTNNVFVYRMIKALIRRHYVPTGKVRQCNWSVIFDKCDQLGIYEMAKLDLVYDYDHVNLVLVEAKNNPYHSQRSSDHQIVFLKTIFKQHLQGLTVCSKNHENIIPFKQFLKK